MGSKISGLYHKIWDWGDYGENSNALEESDYNRINKLLRNCGGSIFVLKRVRYVTLPVLKINDKEK